MTDNDSIKNQGKNFNEKTTHYNKEIIIDGVDVSDCEFYPNPLGIVSLKELGKRACFDCKSNPDCEFKRQKRFQNQYNKVVAQNNSLQLELKTKSWEIGNLGYKIKNQRREINERLNQLQRKEQECEKIKELIDSCNVKDVYALEDAFCKFEENFIMADAECNKLKAENQELKKILFDKNNKMRGLCLRGHYQSILKENTAYKQALEDIKNILDKPIINFDDEVTYSSMKLDMYLRGETESRLNKLKEVLQIINEVKK